MTRKILYALLISLLLAACTEKTSVKLDSTYARLVVDGNIQSGTGVYRVTLTRSSDYFSNAPAPPVRGAAVTLSDGATTFTLHETTGDSGSTGIYETDSTFTGVAGKTYTLHIQLAEPIAGKSAYEASSVLNPVTRLDSIGTEFHEDWGKKGFWIVRLWAQEPGNEVNYYMFNLYRNGKLLTDTIFKKVVSDDKYFNGSYMNGVDVIYLDNSQDWETIYPGDTIMLQMSGITREYYDFVNEVDMSGYSIPFFSGPPANIKGNISGGGIGFFIAYSNSYAKKIVK